MNRAKLSAAAVLAFFLCGPEIALSTEEPALPAAKVQQPRAFGYVLGDVMTQRVLLESAGAPFELAKMPGTQRVGIWLERRSARVATDGDDKRWLIVEYQLINAPRILTTITVPPLLLESSGKSKLLVPEWSVSLSPLTPQSSAFDKAGMGELRPDRPAALIQTTPIKRQVWMGFLALAVTVAAWAGWTLWRNRLAALNQPFARAFPPVTMPRLGGSQGRGNAYSTHCATGARRAQGTRRKSRKTKDLANTAA